MSSSAAPPLPRFVVAQTGARRGYAVPLILSKAGMFERLYTDVCGNVGWGRWLAAGAVLPWVGTYLRKLANRRVPEEIREETHTAALPNLRWWARRMTAPDDYTEEFRLDVLRHIDLGRAAAAEGFGRATCLYVMLTEFSSLLAEARAKGLTVVSEVYILISTERIMAEERRRFPGWEPEPPNWDAVRWEFGLERMLSTAADFYICPSEAVAEDLVTNWEVSRSAIRVVPYGMNARWLQLEPQPQPGRILFVGTADLRKGIHYLAMAAEELKRRGRNYEFRIAGDVSPQVRHQPLCQNLNLLGRVPRHLIHEEFQRADVFVLPSLAEGSAEVTYEALAAGVPLVATAAAGSVARDGIEARIIPERDPIALADAVEQLVENRQLRSRMAAAARLRAADYTWERYGDRLVEALKHLHS